MMRVTLFYDFVHWAVSLSLFLFCSCDRKLGQALDAAQNNKHELETALEYFNDESNSLKYRSAQFLIKNMPSHYTHTSEAVDSFVYRMLANAATLTTSQLGKWWKEYRLIDISQIYPDVQHVTSEFLIDNIERAVDILQKSPWKHEVSEDLFLNHVLPYRFHDEMLPPVGWRDSLYNKYHHVVDTVTDLRRAYTALYRAATTDVKVRHIGDMPYLLNSIDIGQIKRGRCLQQCIYVASVMRAFGIPAVIDGVSLWANYSTTGHSWVALVTDDGTYTVYGGDSIAKKYNPINSSYFSIKYPVEPDFPISLDFRKTVAKVRRRTYVMNEMKYSDSNADRNVTRLFSSCNSIDVSAEYGFTHHYKVSVPMGVECAYLCIFGTGKDWIPIDYAMAKWGECTFENIADSVIYLPMAYIEGKLSPLDMPFHIMNGKVIHIIPDEQKKERVTLYRKYPFARSILRPWQETLGSYIIASNDKDFIHADTLFTLTRTPIYKNVIKPKVVKKYRYVQYASNPKRRGSITEFQVFSRDSLLVGIPFISGAADKENCFDGNTFTGLRNLQIGYRVGLDIGESVPVDSVIFYSRNDGNYIDVGDDYELLHYNRNRWESLGRQKAKMEWLTFPNVPEKALLLLKNHTKGKEERIFTYENGKQVWW